MTNLQMLMGYAKFSSPRLHSILADLEDREMEVKTRRATAQIREKIALVKMAIARREAQENRGEFGQ